MTSEFGTKRTNGAGLTTSVLRCRPEVAVPGRPGRFFPLSNTFHPGTPPPNPDPNPRDGFPPPVPPHPPRQKWRDTASAANALIDEAPTLHLRRVVNIRGGKTARSRHFLL